jgi:glycosyltransferase involved in cell wall biosynthesis
MARIVWQTEYQELIDAFQQKRLLNDSRGGFVYEYAAAHCLASSHDVIMDSHSARRRKENSITYSFRLLSSRIKGDIFIKSASVINHGKINKKDISIGILHHIYLKEKKKTLWGKLSLFVLHKKLRSLDYVVCVSEYWHNYLENIGCKNVKKIYNSFDMNEFVFGDDEIQRFLMNHNIPSDKPIIYMGLAKPQKGILEVYNALKHEDYTLVMTGPFNPEVDIPVKRLFLDRHDYLCLLKTSTAVVSMPIIEEGWSRVAHESMLCGTPVIGSGTGGMKELLDGGRQMICNDFHNLSAVTKVVIEQREKYAADGYNYAIRFDLSCFQREWHGFIQEVLANRQGRI